MILFTYYMLNSYYLKLNFDLLNFQKHLDFSKILFKIKIIMQKLAEK